MVGSRSPATEIRLQEARGNSVASSSLSSEVGEDARRRVGAAARDLELDENKEVAGEAGLNSSPLLVSRRRCWRRAE